jgi:muramoyltetrapeptide carboxypeptidase
MRIIKPKQLKRGDVIGICAPSSPSASENKLNKGIRYLEQLGFRVDLGKNVYHQRGYLAGTDLQRASDINQFFADPKIKAIFTVRGGYGSHRILPLLDYNIIKHNPKILVGYSDITALHFALFSKIGLVTFSGPMVAVEMANGMTKNTEEQFWDCLMSVKPPHSIKGCSTQSSILQRSGSATGRLLGGNLSLITGLVGTQFFPSIRDPIFIFEEIDESPYRIDRMLQQIKLSGILEKTKGIALADFSGCNPEKGKPSLTLRQIFRDTFQGYSFPIVSSLPIGHIKGSLSFPIGVNVKMDGRKNCIEILEAGVTK